MSCETNELTPRQARRLIEDGLRPEVLEWWTGCCEWEINTFVILAQRTSVAETILEVNKCAEGEQNESS